MEYLDVYDENQNYLGKEERSIVHKNALWHNTVHCWLYDKDGNIYFQIRKEEGKLYTTASGHIQSGESIKEGFGREIKEEIGIDVDCEKCTLVKIEKFKLDRENKDGSIFRDRAFANIYACEYKGNCKNFDLDESEVKGLVKINAKEALNVLKNEYGKINGFFIDLKNNIISKEILFEDFLVNKGETAIGKYGDVLNKIIELTNR